MNVSLPKINIIHVYECLIIFASYLNYTLPKLLKLESGQDKEITLWIIDSVANYNECKAKHGAVVKAL